VSDLHPDVIEADSCESIDFESALIRRGLPAPVPVCCAFYFPGEEPELHGLYELFPRLIRLLSDSRRCILGHNIAYDMCLALEWGPVLGYPEIVPLIFEAYDADRVYDTLLAQRLIEIEEGDKRGKLGLDECCKRYGLFVEKREIDEFGYSVRKGFGRYIGCKASELPKQSYDYAIGDPQVTHELFRRQLRRGYVKRKDLAELARNDLALKLTSAFGMMTDAERVVKLEARARERIVELQEIMFRGRPLCDQAGNPRTNAKGEALFDPFMRWERGNPKPVKNTKAIKRACADAYELQVDENGMYTGPGTWLEDLQNQGLITEGGNMSTSRLVLEESGDPLLMSLADYNEWAAVWNKDLKLFRTSVDVPFHTRFGFAATLRTTSGGPNIQNFRKKEGIRECIVARYGALVASDYTGLENCTLASVIYRTLGRRGMLDKINAGHNFHSEVGCHILGWDPTPENMKKLFELKEAGNEECKEAYGAAKPLNFGLPGFMKKATTVQSYARIGYKVNRPVAFWQSMIDLWYRTQHDQVAYLHEYVLSLRGDDRLFTVPIPGSGVVRSGATQTAAANTGFQGLGGRIALRGLYYTVRAQLLHAVSGLVRLTAYAGALLMPGRVCAFIHDEEISDCREDQIEEVRHGQEHWMAKAGESLEPEIRWSVASVAMLHWSKKAKAKFDQAGRMLLDTSH
jgi:hypothetical protein